MKITSLIEKRVIDIGLGVDGDPEAIICFSDGTQVSIDLRTTLVKGERFEEAPKSRAVIHRPN